MAEEKVVVLSRDSWVSQNDANGQITTVRWCFEAEPSNYFCHSIIVYKRYKSEYRVPGVNAVKGVLVLWLAANPDAE